MMSTLKNIELNTVNDKVENLQENSFTQDEPQYQTDNHIDLNQQYEEIQDHMQLPLYTPQQFCQYKRKPTNFDEFYLDEDPKKKVCSEQFEEQQPMGDLEKLADQLQRENLKKYSYPKTLPAPQNVDDHLDELNLRFTPSIKQDEFISNYIKGDDLLRIKVGLCDDIINDEETLKFEDWVEQLCTSTNHESLKEMARKQKVKRYLEKKHNRTYEKKVHYHIRQKVAEERLRVKGRFVTWGQAIKMLNEQDQKKSWNYNDYFKIKSMLNEKFGAVKSERSLRF